MRGAPAATRGASAAARQEYRRNFYYFGDSRNIYFFGEFRTEPLFTRAVRRETFEGYAISRRITADAAEYTLTGGAFQAAAMRVLFAVSTDALIQMRSQRAKARSRIR